MAYWKMYNDDMRDVISRFKSFKNWSILHPTLPTPKKLAGAGLSFEEESDAIVCESCHRVTTVESLYASTAAAAAVLPETFHEVGCRTKPNPFAGPHVDALVKATPIPKFDGYRTFEARVKSLQNSTVTRVVTRQVGNEPGSVQTIVSLYDVEFNAAELASSGFFRTGATAEYIVQCFACGLHLVEWDFGADDPIEEHAKYSPTCPYLRLAVGIPYVRRVARVYIESDLYWVLEYTRHSNFILANYSHELVQCLSLSKFRLDYPEKMEAFLADHERFVKDCEANKGRPYPPRLKPESYVLGGKEDEDGDEKKEDEEKERLRHPCVICVSKPACIVFLPCAHATVCLNCMFSSPHLHEKLNCYVCKQPVAEMFRIETQ